MALHNTHMIITTSNLKADDTAKQCILQNTPSATIDIIKLELNSQKSVCAFTNKFLVMNLPLNIFIETKEDGEKWKSMSEVSVYIFSFVLV
ncbi:short-chain dehydrogenase TIC 32 A, chloroplastic-like [Zingiber officinale]|uniref:short-chain dehydrogenase TIC 32 A, chloroplastic-like n=1 Tax=Zingiber officinale TaxID=94328 RepID=UPI001C4CE555|nr:short-chain dehydrogenase TIC 32 A, chloroplastic-like [Zingiber officinale]